MVRINPNRFKKDKLSLFSYGKQSLMVGCFYSGPFFLCSFEAENGLRSLMAGIKIH